ncbi:MAG TPA: DNA topoisomerase I, partial [archaeon]|nr:DNA topoisomerase I [archaeon]
KPSKDGVQWRTLVHHGVLFPPPYAPHGVRLLYDGRPVDLTPAQEEIATFYAQYIDSQHVQKEMFRKNFFAEFSKVLGGTAAGRTIKSLERCNFRPIKDHLDAERERKKGRSKEEKDAEKAAKAAVDEKYGWAVVDGHRQKVANFRVEPPGLFLGRGAHPKTGQLKARLRPSDVTINIGAGAKVPECPVRGESWGEVRHDNTVSWLAMWRENINGAHKYVFLSAQSAVKGRKDVRKFDVARELKSHIARIRKAYEKDMKSKDEFEKQRGTALWVIDKLALRVGNEKGEEEADTVGCCSLRVEHIKLLGDLQLEFDFLGKDSMRYHNVVAVPDTVH